MSDIYIQAERELAELLGWTNIVDVGGTLMGQPVEGSIRIRGQAPIPKWARDNEATFLLMVEHGLYLVEGTHNDSELFWVFDGLQCLAEANIADHPCKFSAARLCATKAGIAKLKGKAITGLQAAPVQPQAEQPQVAWDEAQRICDLPQVDEAIRNLLEDQTGDNATCLVRAILEAAPAAAQPVAAQPQDGWPHNFKLYTVERVRELPHVWGVSRDAESPGARTVLVAFERKLTDDELRALHERLNAQAAPAVPDARDAEIARLTALINSPELHDFAKGVVLEAAHQREKWGSDHDVGKSPFDWFWLVGYLAQKAADSAVRGDQDKALHHTITTAAVLANWHAAISGTSNSMRPGIDTTAIDSVTAGGSAPKKVQ